MKDAAGVDVGLSERVSEREGDQGANSDEPVDVDDHRPLI